MRSVLVVTAIIFMVSFRGFGKIPQKESPFTILATLATNPWSIQMKDHTLYTGLPHLDEGSSPHEMEIWDVSTPLKTKKVGVISESFAFYPVKIIGHFLYASNAKHVYRVYDIGNLTHPKLIQEEVLPQIGIGGQSYFDQHYAVFLPETGGNHNILIYTRSEITGKLEMHSLVKAPEGFPSPHDIQTHYMVNRLVVSENRVFALLSSYCREIRYWSFDIENPSEQINEQLPVTDQCLGSVSLVHNFFGPVMAVSRHSSMDLIDIRNPKKPKWIDILPTQNWVSRAENVGSEVFIAPSLFGLFVMKMNIYHYDTTRIPTPGSSRSYTMATNEAGVFIAQESVLPPHGFDANLSFASWADLGIDPNK